MRTPLSVNQVIASLDELEGKDVLVRGLLHFSFEDIAIYQWPKEQGSSDSKSSIWLSVGGGSLGFDGRVCEKLSGKVVLVEGAVVKPDPRLGGCGHMSLWPAEIVARTLERSDER